MLEPAWATLTHCEDATRCCVIRTFLRAALIGFEQAILKKIAPRTLSHSSAVQIAADIDHIRNWAAKIDEAETRRVREERERQQEEKAKKEEKEKEREGELVKSWSTSHVNDENESPEIPMLNTPHNPHVTHSSHLNAGNYRITKVNSFDSATTSSAFTLALPPHPPTKPPYTTPNLLSVMDFARWNYIVEILTTWTNPERAISIEEFENLPVPDFSKWLALCRRQ